MSGPSVIGVRRRRRIAVVVGVLQLCTACYVYVPVRTPPPALGSQLAIEVNDEGRLGLREQLGPGVVRVEGRLKAVDGDALILDGMSVTQLRGYPLPLDGVQVRVSQRFVDRMDQWRLSRGRTWFAAGTAAAIVASFLLTKGYSGRGTPPETPVLPPGKNN